MVILASDDFVITRGIVESYFELGRLQSVEGVKLDIDQDSRRYKLTKIEDVYKGLELQGLVTAPGPHTGSRRCTEAGKVYFKEFRDQFPRKKDV